MPPSVWRMRWRIKPPSTFLKMEERHVDWAQQQRVQIEQMGLENYLTNQTKGTVRIACVDTQEEEGWTPPCFQNLVLCPTSLQRTELRSAVVAPYQLGEQF